MAALPPRGGSQADPRLPVWDLVVRVLHWSLATVVVFDWVRDDGDRLHRIVGYVGAGIVVLRLLWSLGTRGHGRLALLKTSPQNTLSYLRAHAPRHVGHDPLGLWMVWLIWLLVLLLAATGWMSRLDAFWGDERVHDVHAWLADALGLCVLVHLAGVAVMSWRWRENLAASMITGRKRAPSADPGAPS